jgi:hypothetical protein
MQFSEDEAQIDNKHMKKYSTSLDKKGNANQMTLRFHLTQIRMDIFKKTNKKNAGEDAIKWECNLVQLLWK